jgi:hypothetical protein
MSDRNDRLLDRFASRSPLADLAPPDDGEPETLGCFGLLRGRDRAVSAELRRRTGESIALPYSYISRIEYLPSVGIVLHCGDAVVRIRGRNLINHEVRPGVTLFNALARHRVPWACEADRAAALQSAEGAVVIEAIEW